MTARVHLIISGDVQGVGFRAWIKKQAGELGISGWVKNRPDGSVEVVGEGEKQQLTELISRCHNGPDVAWVEGVAVRWGDMKNEFVTFSVLY